MPVETKIRVGKASYVMHPESVAVNGVIVANDIPVNRDSNCIVITPSGHAAMSECNRPHVYRNYAEAAEDVAATEDAWLGITRNANSHPTPDPTVSRYDRRRKSNTAGANQWEK